MDVIGVLREIIFVADAMFPIAGLPQFLFGWHAQMVPGEALDLRPSQGIIVITLRQTPETMQMIWKQHPSLYEKWIFISYRLHGSSQSGSDILAGKYRAAIMRNQREEIAASGYTGTAVVGHWIIQW